ncbi:hypothetical protein [Nocardioides zeae]
MSTASLAADTLAFMGLKPSPALTTQAEAVVGVIAAMAQAYTRGNGFEAAGPVEPIAHVIVSASARLLANPDQIDVTIGSTRRSSYFQGWTLVESMVLNAYRGVAA